MQYNRHTHPYQTAAGWALLVLAIPLLWWVSHPARQVVFEPMQFVFWHSVAELFAVVVAMLVFVTGYRAILSARKGAVVLLGVAFLGVGLLDFLHTLSYVGMPDAVTANTPHKSMFFWLAARLLAAGLCWCMPCCPQSPPSACCESVWPWPDAGGRQRPGLYRPVRARPFARTVHSGPGSDCP